MKMPHEATRPVFTTAQRVFALARARTLRARGQRLSERASDILADLKLTRSLTELDALADELVIEIGLLGHDPVNISA